MLTLHIHKDSLSTRTSMHVDIDASDLPILLTFERLDIVKSDETVDTETVIGRDEFTINDKIIGIIHYGAW